MLLGLGLAAAVAGLLCVWGFVAATVHADRHPRSQASGWSPAVWLLAAMTLGAWAVLLLLAHVVRLWL